MNDDELIERLRATLEIEAQAIRPGQQPTRATPVRRPRRSDHKLQVLAVLATAAAVAAVLAVATNLHQPPTKVEVGGTPTTASPTSTTATSTNTNGKNRTTTGTTPSTTATPAVGATNPAPPTTLPTAPTAQLPAHFDPLSVTFVSATQGWVLGTSPCGTAQCLWVADTTNRGASWTFAKGPATTDLTQGTDESLQIRFANLQDGWILGDLGGTAQLWSTQTGGATWTATTLPGASGDARIYDLETSDGYAVADLLPQDDSNVQVDSTTVGSNVWTRATSIAGGAGPIPNPELVVEHDRAWLLENDRVVISGATLQGGAWSSWQPPCIRTEGTEQVAAPTTADLVAVCSEGTWNPVNNPTTGKPGVFQEVYTSTNGGASFTAGPVLPNADQLIDLTAASTEDLVGVSETSVSTLIGSFNGGTTWQTVATSPGSTFVQVGFENANQGVAIATNGNGNQLFLTANGGRTWTATPIS